MSYTPTEFISQCKEDIQCFNFHVIFCDHSLLLSLRPTRTNFAGMIRQETKMKSYVP